tara:strand:- start:2399 stop:6958 length:4560 start_codon:yes stop_codon:yes gene_type:complete
MKRKLRNVCFALAGVLIGLFSFKSMKAQILLSEDFTNYVDSITPPTGWLNVDSAGTGQVWRFDNPGYQTISSPMSSPSAILDSDWYGSLGSQDAILVSDTFDASSVVSVYLSFDHYFEPWSGSYYEVLVYNGTSWDTIINSSASTASPQSESVDITSYVSGVSNARVAFRYVGSNGFYWILDNVVVENVTCPVVTALDTFDVSATTASLTWAPGGTESQWEIEYGQSGFSQGIGTSSVVTNDTVALTGLSSSTNYDYYVRAICGAGDTANWVGPFEFSTTCGIYTTPFLEDFNSGTFVPMCWEEATSGTPASGPSGFGSGSWTSDDFGNNTSNSEAARINLYTNSKEDWILSPYISLTAGVNYQLEFDFAITDYGNSSASSMGSDDTVQVLITNDFGATWIPLMTWDVSSSVSTTGDHETIYLLSAYSGDTVQVAFWGSEGSVNDPEDYDVFVDNVAINEIPSCASPTSLDAYNIGSNSVEVTWEMPPSLGAPEYQIEYGTYGFAQGAGSSSIVTNDTALIQGLTENTSYDYYVRAICGVGDTSVWSGPYSFQTMCGLAFAPFNEDFESAEWIAGTGGTNSGDAISNCWSRNPESGFFWGVHSGTTTSTLTGPSGDNTTGSGNYLYTEASSGSTGDTALIVSPYIDMTAMSNAFLSFAYHMYGNNIEALYIQVDDGAGWATLDSIIGEQQGDNNDPWGIKTVDLTTFMSDTIQIRWIAEKGSSYNGDIAIDDISIFNEDALDASVVTLIEPESYCGDSNTIIQAVIQNLGTNTISGFDVVLSWTGTTTGTSSITYNGSLGYYETDTVNIDTLITIYGGTFNLEVYTNLSGDQELTNDTVAYQNVTFIVPPASPSIPASILSCNNEDVTISTASSAPTGIETMWYDASMTFLGLGDSITIPGGQQPGVFYAINQVYSDFNIGAPDTSIGTNSNYTYYTSGMYFDVFENIVIDSITVYPNDTGIVYIEVEDNSGNVVATSSAAVYPSIPNEETRIHVGISLSPGTDYYISPTGTTTGGLIRNNSGASFPYTIGSGEVELTASSLSGYYYFLYDWKVTKLGCESQAVTTTISVDTVVVALGNDTTYCANETFSSTLDAGNAGASFVWNDGSTAQTLVADTAGTFYVEVTNANNCTVTDTLVVTENAVPVMALGSDTAYCSNETFAVTLDAGNAGASFEWNDGSTTQTLVVDTAGTYSVEVTNSNNCSVTDTVEVVENVAPVVALGNDTAYCSDEAFAVTLDAGNAGASFVWNDSSTAQTLAIDSAGSYFVEVVDANNCSATDTLEVVEYVAPEVMLTDEEICEGETVTFDAGAGYASYNWSTGDTTQSIDATVADNYSVVVTSAEGCDDTAEVELVVNALPVVDLGADTSLAPGGSITLDAGAGYADYTWNDGSTDQTLDVAYADVPGDFYVTVVTAEGCAGSDTIYIDARVSVQEYVNGTISVYPNPARDYVTLELSAVQSGSLTLELYTVTGQMLETKQNVMSAGNQNFQIDLSEYGSGYYFIKAKVNGELIGDFRIVKL